MCVCLAPPTAPSNQRPSVLGMQKGSCPSPASVTLGSRHSAHLSQYCFFRLDLIGCQVLHHRGPLEPSASLVQSAKLWPCLTCSKASL